MSLTVSKCIFRLPYVRLTCLTARCLTLLLISAAAECIGSVLQLSVLVAALTSSHHTAAHRAPALRSTQLRYVMRSLPCIKFLPPTRDLYSVLWHCWLGDRKGIRPVQNIPPALSEGFSDLLETRPHLELSSGKRAVKSKKMWQGHYAMIRISRRLSDI